MTLRPLKDSSHHRSDEASQIRLGLPLAPLAPLQVSLDESIDRSVDVVAPPSPTAEEPAEVEGPHQDVISHSPVLEAEDGAFEKHEGAAVKTETESGADTDVRLPEGLKRSRASLWKLFATPDGLYLTSGILLSIALAGGISVLGLLQSTGMVDSRARMIIEDVELDKTSKDWLISITGIINYVGSGNDLIKNIKVWVDFGHVTVLVNRVNITYEPYESMFLKDSNFYRIVLTAKYPHLDNQITINEMDLEIIHENGKGEITDKIDVLISKYI